MAVKKVKLIVSGLCLISLDTKGSDQNGTDSSVVFGLLDEPSHNASIKINNDVVGNNMYGYHMSLYVVRASARKNKIQLNDALGFPPPQGSNADSFSWVPDLSKLHPGLADTRSGLKMDLRKLKGSLFVNDGKLCTHQIITLATVQRPSDGVKHSGQVAESVAVDIELEDGDEAYLTVPSQAPFRLSERLMGDTVTVYLDNDCQGDGFTGGDFGAFYKLTNIADKENQYVISVPPPDDGVGGFNPPSVCAPGSGGDKPVP